MQPKPILIPERSKPSLVSRLLARLYPSPLNTRAVEITAFWRESVGEARRSRGLIGVVASVWFLLADLVLSWFRGAPSLRLATAEPSGDSTMLTWLSDLKYSFRSLIRLPVLTSTSVLSLAIGLGGALSIFAASYAVLFRPLPFHDPDTLVSVDAMVQRDTLEARGFSVPDFLDYRASVASVLPQLAAWDTVTFSLRADGAGTRVSGESVTSNYFALLGVTPVLGTTLPIRETEPEVPALVISEGIWSRQFGSDPGIVGRTVYADEMPFEVVGVLPETFRGISDQAELWIALAPPLISERTWQSRSARWLGGIGRLADGVSPDTADAAVKTVAVRLAQEYPTSNANYTARVRPLRAAFYATVTPQIWVLLAAVGAVLFMTCINVANLLVSRLSARQFEFAVRASLGASKRRLLSLASADGLVLAVLGALAGAPLTVWLVRVLHDLNPAALPGFAAPSISWPVAGAGVVLTLIAAAFIALASVLSLRQPGTGLLTSARTSSDNTRTVFLRRTLTTLQVACATALLTTAALLGLSLRQLNQVEPGFRSDHLLAARLDLPTARYEPERRLVAKADLFARLQNLPGVREAALASDVMLGGNWSAYFYSVDKDAPADADREGRVYVHDVTHNFFEVSGIPLLEGTTLPVFDGTAIDPAQPDVPVVVSEKLARRFWPDASAVGQRLKLGRSASERPWMRIVGVVGETKFRGLPDNPTQDPDVYRPLGASPSPDVALLLSTDVAPLSLTGALSKTVESIDPLLAPYGLFDMSEQVAAATSSQRFLSKLSGAFGLVALLLAIVGTYGVVAYQVLLARRATGIRLALGARPRQIFLGVMGGTARLVVVGLAGGIVLALYAARAVTELLFQPPASNAPIISAVALVVTVVALLSAWWPARRAMNVNPVSVLRND